MKDVSSLATSCLCQPLSFPNHRCVVITCYRAEFSCNHRSGSYLSCYLHSTRLETTALWRLCGASIFSTLFRKPQFRVHVTCSNKYSQISRPCRYQTHKTFCRLHKIWDHKSLIYRVGFEVLTAVVMKSTIFWDITSCSPLKVNRRFGRTYRLHLMRRISRARYQRESWIKKCG
jgi:hypothetical protein